jgi:hypothetical protein
MLNNIHDNDQDYLYLIDILTSRQFEHEHHKNPTTSLCSQIKRKT